MNDYTNYKGLIESLENDYFFYSHNLKGKYLYISPSVEKILGYSVEEARKGIVKYLTDCEANKEVLELLQKSATGEQQKTFELELYTKSGKIKIIEITESPIFDNHGKVISVEGVAHDITDRKNHERIIRQQNEELKRKEEELRNHLNQLSESNKNIDKLKQELEDRSNLLLNIINEIPEKIFLKDENGKFIIANTPVAANYGMKPEELIGKSDFDLYPDHLAEQKYKREQEIIKSGTIHSYEEGSFDKEDGLIVNTRIKPFKLDELHTGILGIQVDITQVRKKELELQELNSKLTFQTEELNNTLKNLQETQSQLVHSEKMRALGDLIAGIAHEINTPIGAVNASVSNISASLDASMQNLYKLFTSLTKKELMIFLRIMNLMEKSKPALNSKEKRQYKKEIQRKFDLAGFKEVPVICELILYLNLYDDTDEVIRMLNVNDPVFILQSIRNIYSVRKNAENIKLAVDKASKLVFALKKFAHKDITEKKEQANLIENIETVLILHHNQLKQGIEVIKDYEEVPLINCYPDELMQVWTNLISNSIHAMDYHGDLTITVRNLGKKVKVSISDIGHGIPDEIKQRIFEPFFTTKKSGEGTGIGLDIVKRILDKHNATMELESEIGVGTSFHITLPVN
ncbi:PAS domain-containing sensor histidine kinase [Maribellus sediminis]|uniref:PAS domain-containing sensor histidine kinase n=1 Tax=Maribellus sediminis TaxID=2696285 RepID=UPI001430793B|nr:PAS domain S-box protein [Maribellus sediminis]